MGCGIGYVDVSILAPTVLMQANLWSRNKRLMALATELGCAYSLESFESIEGREGRPVRAAVLSAMPPMP